MDISDIQHEPKLQAGFSKFDFRGRLPAHQSANAAVIIGHRNIVHTSMSPLGHIGKDHRVLGDVDRPFDTTSDEVLEVAFFGSCAVHNLERDVVKKSFPLAGERCSHD